MHMASPETKVGLFAIIAIVAMVSLFMWLNGTELFEKGSEMEAVFGRVEGLRPGAPVKYIGVDIGRITRIYFDDQSVVVVFRIHTEVELPENIEATIASAGVVGDKYLELHPSPNETPSGKRILGKNPSSMEDFYASAAEILKSIKNITAKLNTLVGDEELSTSLKDTVVRVNRLSAVLERMAVNSEPQVYELLNNINLASSRLAEAGLTANRMLTQIDNNGQTATDIRETLNHIKTVSANLERFSGFLANNDSKLTLLMDDAHQTMQSINQAAQSIDKAIKGFSTEGGELSEIRKTINEAGEAAQKVDAYVSMLEKIDVTHSIGAGYHYPRNLEVDYSIDLRFNEKNSLYLAYEDIGDQNLGSFQFVTSLPNPSYQGRAGVYRNKFGVGLNYQPYTHWNFGVDLWDVDSVNFGLSSRWKASEKWSMLLSAETNLENRNDSWSLEWWHHF